MGHVVVVGAGPAGAVVALLLARRGVRVTLLERRLDFAREFRGEVLMPSGVGVLEEMGLAGRFADLPGCTQERMDFYLDRRHVFGLDLDSAGEGGARIVAVSQPALLEMLVEEAAATDSFRLIRGALVTDLLHGDGRCVGVRMRVGDREEELRADLVIGADGRNSAVRRKAGLTAREASPPMDIVWCKVPRPDGGWGVRGYAGRGHLLIAYPTWGGMLQIGWVILKGTFGALRARGIGQWVDEMAAHVTPDLATHLRAHRDVVERPFLLDVESDCVLRWSAPGLLVLGDAAHTMSPVGGQGINIALRDAVVADARLGPLLAAPVPDGGALDAACAAVESERLPEVRTIQALQAQPPRILLSRAWWGEPLRRLAATLLPRPLFRGRAGATAALFLHGVTQIGRVGAASESA